MEIKAIIGFDGKKVSINNIASLPTIATLVKKTDILDILSILGSCEESYVTYCM